MAASSQVWPIINSIYSPSPPTKECGSRAVSFKLFMESTKSHLIRTKDTCITQEILRELGALYQTFLSVRAL